MNTPLPLANLSPENYTAIYARHSINKEKNVSNKGQINECKIIASKLSLIVYNSYEDQGSGLHTPPIERPGFLNLIEDAKAGYFKNIIVWKADRLVRNSNHFEDTKKLLNSLGIRLILGDMIGFENVPPLYKDFMLNIFIAMAELEPNRILEKADSCRKVKRELGIYNPVTPPFGFNPITDKATILLKEGIDSYILPKITTYYEKDPFEAAFVVTAFNLYNATNGSRAEKTNFILSKMNKLKDLFQITNFDDFKNHFDGLIELITDPHLLLIKTEFVNLSKKITTEKDSFEKVKTAVEKALNYICNYGNLINFLESYCYCKLCPVNTKGTTKCFLPINGSDSYKYNEDALQLCRNFDLIVNEDVWKEACKHIYETKKSSKAAKNYPFKGMLKCYTCNNRIKTEDMENYKCGKGCINISKKVIIERIVENLIEDRIIENLQTKLETLTKLNEQKIKNATGELNALQKTMTEITLEFLKSKSVEKAKQISEVAEKSKLIKESLNQLLLNVSSGNSTMDLICSKKSRDKEELRKRLINFFISDEFRAEIFLKQLIKEVTFKSETISRNRYKSEYKN